MFEVKSKVKRFIVDNLLMTGHDVSDDVSLQGVGAVDSTGVLELVAFLETQFAIRIEDADLRPENLDTVKAITQFVTRKLAVSGLGGRNAG